MHTHGRFTVKGNRQEKISASNLTHSCLTMESKGEEGNNDHVADLEPIADPTSVGSALVDGLPSEDAAGRGLVVSLLRGEAEVKVSAGPVSLESIKLACRVLVSPWCTTTRLECVHGCHSSLYGV